MGREQGRSTAQLLEGIDDVEVLGGAVDRVERLVVRSQLGQGALQAMRVAGQLHRRRVRKVLALAADRHLHEGSEHVADGRHDHPDQQQNDREPTASSTVVVAAPATEEERVSQEEACQQRQAADHHADDQSEADVVVADVR